MVYDRGLFEVKPEPHMQVLGVAIAQAGRLRGQVGAAVKPVSALQLMLPWSTSAWRGCLSGMVVTLGKASHGDSLAAG